MRITFLTIVLILFFSCTQKGNNNPFYKELKIAVGADNKFRIDEKVYPMAEFRSVFKVSHTEMTNQLPLGIDSYIIIIMVSENTKIASLQEIKSTLAQYKKSIKEIIYQYPKKAFKAI